MPGRGTEWFSSNRSTIYNLQYNLYHGNKTRGLSSNEILNVFHYLKKMRFVLIYNNLLIPKANPQQSYGHVHKVFKAKHGGDTFKGNLFTQPEDVHFKQQPWAGFQRQGEIGQMDWLHDLSVLLKKKRQPNSEPHLIFERISQLKYPTVTDVKRSRETERWKDRQSFRVIVAEPLGCGCLRSYHLHQKHSYPRPKLPQHQTQRLKRENANKPERVFLWNPHLNFGLRWAVIVYPRTPQIRWNN